MAIWLRYVQAVRETEKMVKRSLFGVIRRDKYNKIQHVEAETR